MGHIDLLVDWTEESQCEIMEDCQNPCPVFLKRGPIEIWRLWLSNTHHAFTPGTAWLGDFPFDPSTQSRGSATLLTKTVFYIWARLGNFGQQGRGKIWLVMVYLYIFACAIILKYRRPRFVQVVFFPWKWKVTQKPWLSTSNGWAQIQAARAYFSDMVKVGKVWRLNVPSLFFPSLS